MRWGLGSDLAKRSLSTQNNVRQWINRVRIVPASQPLIPPVVDRAAQQAIYEGLLQDKQIECVYRARVNQGEDKNLYFKSSCFGPKKVL